MKKILPILIVGVLVLSGIGAIAIDADENNKPLEKNISLFASEPTFSMSDNYVMVNIQEETSVSMETGKPMLPVITKVFAFEPGTEIYNVEVNYDVKEYVLTDKIAPAPEPVPLLDSYENDVSAVAIRDPLTYLSAESYPSEPYTISYPFGIYQGERQQMVVVKVNSQYNAVEDTLLVPQGYIDITIEYDEPEQQQIIGETYDMLIITPQKFTTKINKLVNHKEDMGISCIVETIEDIYSTYEGRNQPEDIKLCIKDAIETYDITYVLLAGGRKMQKLDWWVPEFRGWNDDGWESGYASDLYYADVYKNGGADFEDWDSNENEIFGEWNPEFPPSIDIMDFVPDVIIGRIPFHFGFELDIVIKKIIAYETGAAGSDWFNNALVCAGDTFPAENSFYEGEIETGITADMLEDKGFTVKKLWTSLETLTGVPDVVTAISAGRGFVHFAGHGNPSTWSTHPPGDKKTWITGLSFNDMYKLRNRNEYPFVLVGGCHNAQFNATLGYIMQGIREMGIEEYFDRNGSDDTPDQDGTYGPFWLMEWMPRDFCSWLLLRNNGGSIGSVGMTSLGYGYQDDAAPLGLGGWIEPRVFQAYAEQDIDILGACHSQAITDYINIIGYINEDQIDRKTIEAFVLLADPSLKLGGYE